MLYNDYRETFNEHEAVQSKRHKYHFKSVPCPECGSQEEITVFGADLFNYQSGQVKLIQEAFPYLTAAQRERFITGICGNCYDEVADDMGE